MKKITLAHSPDADDIFMYYAIKFGWVHLDGFSFENQALDIESLNEKAILGEFDISAISFGLYPLISEEFALLKTAVSFGYGYGPKLIKKKNKTLKKNFKVALSGKYTTNALIFKLAYPEARIKYYNFLEIENAVLNDEVDAGVLIHESILNFSESLELEAEIFDIWLDLAKDNLPLPLGGMALRRSIPILRAIDLENILIKAVEIANKNKLLLSKMLMERNLIRVSDEELQKYLSMYADEKSIVMDDKQLNAIDKLFEIGHNHGFYEKLINSRDMLIPSEYKEIRFS